MNTSLLAPDLEIIAANKSFGSFRALTNVSLKLAPGTIHALLGENGAGKSTLVKGLIGYSPLDSGQILFDGREVQIAHPRAAQALGIGMVYQHFTVAPGMTVAENLVLARGKLPWQIRWTQERETLEDFMANAPFRVPLDAMVGSLAAGEKQKLEILKQLYLKHRLLILDEPTSVLTQPEAEEVLGLLRDMAHRGTLSVLMITHKFSEVLAYADDVTVLRHGRKVANAAVIDTHQQQMAEWIMGSAAVAMTTRSVRPPVPDASPRLVVDKLNVDDDRGLRRVHDVSFAVRAGEIVGLAGISGNGQKELVEALLGQRNIAAGSITIDAQTYRATRAEMRKHNVYSLPEEPLLNAVVARSSVAANLALRNFDRSPILRAGCLVSPRQIQIQARERIAAFNVRPPDAQRAIGTLSGGNVQRAVLARELSESVRVLIAANPVFGLDFKAVADIHARLLDARDAGTAVLVASDDLDELIELADRLLVIADGRIVLEVSAAEADRTTIGHFMAGTGI
jgi:general nucleoside transport system ATP-binding protein